MPPPPPAGPDEGQRVALEALEAARSTYLEQAALLTELEDLAAEAGAALLDGDAAAPPGASADARLAAAGLPLPADAAASLAAHLAAAFAAQRLALPAPPAGAGQADAGGGRGDDQLLGSRRHLLGVAPQQLKALHLPSRRAAQKAHTPLLPLLERRLEARAQAAVEAVAGPGAGPEAQAHVASLIQGKRAALAALRSGCRQQLARYAEHAQAYLEDLAATQQVLQQLLGECILLEQPALDEKHRQYLDAMMTQLSSKLRLMQLQVRDHTYDAKALPALHAIRAELERAETEAADAVAQVQTQLLQYAQLGEEFGGIVPARMALQRAPQLQRPLQLQPAALHPRVVVTRAARQPAKPAKQQGKQRAQRAQVEYGAGWYEATRQAPARTVREEIAYRKEANRLANNGRERKDLYTEAWDGSEWKGGNVNVLTVIAAISVLVPLLGLAFAFFTFGELWG
ncbi:hypothetical protein HT031_005452 [Scenedesmus sp. PABB004]|nr:hypothetical protein HT031_005452 [Scenedesmus sp. PABB004]